MRAECAKRLFQTLLVADVREDVFEHRHQTSFARRDVHSACAIEHKRPVVFSVTAFPAGVRPRYHQAS